MNRKELIKAVNAADISEAEWFDNILELMTDKYAKGYLDRFATELGEGMSSTDEEYREELLSVIEDYDIFDK